MGDVSLALQVDLVKAAEDAVSVIQAVVSAANRSVVIEVDNVLPVALTLESSNNSHGGFDALPNGVIPPRSPELYSARSSGAATGAEGWCAYQFTGRRLVIHWDNPFVGSNSADCRVEPDDGRYRAIAVVGNGNSSRARFVLVPGNLQDGFRSCPKCQGMYFGGFAGQGVCAAGGQHRSDGSFNYVMMFDADTGDHAQDGFRSCSKCQGMHYAGFPSKGVCAAGGQHEQTNSFSYVMMHDLLPKEHMQIDWRSCQKCLGVFYGPFQGRCPAGNLHDATGSFNYGLMFG